jgi:hypothetical protein
LLIFSSKAPSRWEQASALHLDFDSTTGVSIAGPWNFLQGPGLCRDIWRYASKVFSFS